jgi:hypothetical protein
MHWIYRSLMAAAVVGGSLVSAGVLPVILAPVAVALGTAAGFFHDSPRQAP